jgi:hypothetical protein
MSQESLPPNRKPKFWILMNLELIAARTEKMQQEEIERMNMPTNLGWFKGDTEPVEVHYILTPAGEILQLIEDPEPSPLAARGQYLTLI